MKQLLTLLFACSLFTSRAQHHSLEKIWETDSIVAVPESVLSGVTKNLLYISLIDGGGWDADGKGGVGKLETNGKGYDATWITGLNAPKGMGVYGNRLFVADINNVVVIDIKNGKIEKKIAIDSASGLNDITVSDQGIVYVSDSKTGMIWRIENDKPQLYLSDMNGVNGLKCVKDELFIGSGKSFVKANAQKQITNIALLPEGIDGIEPIGNGDFILTAWVGYIYYVSAGGNIETLLDTHAEKKNTADIGYDMTQRIVYVPTFNAKTIVAYRLR
ncbi:MAG: ATP-binding protein [Ferruginibacter sp.]